MNPSGGIRPSFDGTFSKRAALVRLALLFLLLASGFLLLRWTSLGDLLTLERIAAWLERLRGHWWTPLVLVALYGIFCPLGIPASPFILAGGAIFGVALGTLWNWSGAMLGAVSTFALARLMGREAAERIGGARLRRVEALLRRKGTTMLVGMRFLPLPFVLTNAAAALVGVRFGSFLWTTGVGILPPLVAMTYAASLISSPGSNHENVLRNLSLAFLALGSIVIFPALIRRRLRKRRYRRLRQFRARQRKLPAASTPSLSQRE